LPQLKLTVVVATGVSGVRVIAMVPDWPAASWRDVGTAVTVMVAATATETPELAAEPAKVASPL